MSFALTKSRIIILSGAAVIVLVLILLFAGVIPGLRTKPAPAPPIKLVVWGVFDGPQVYNTLVNSYKGHSGNVDITYKQFDAATYESDLINALAAGTGPDVFMFQNTWLPKHIDKIVPAVESSDPKVIGALPFAEFSKAFPQVISENFAPNRIIYASPLYLDTLAMFYNKDIFDKNGIALPPKNWTEFQEVVKKIREVNPKTNQVLKAGATIGGSNRSINRGTDLLGLLMLQSGTQMVDKNFTTAAFAGTTGDNKNPGLDALNFYTSFANPSSPYYTWNESFHYSIDSFAEGNAAITFNYSHQIPILHAKNPFLNFGVAPTPQIDGTPQPIAYANYWGLAVSNKSKNPDWAWDFVKFATMDEAAAKSYFETTKKPPALNTLIAQNINEPDFGVFIKQTLIARSWPQIDNNVVDNSFSDMIGAVISGRLTAPASLKRAQDEITLLMRQKNNATF